MMPASILATPLINLRSESVYAGKHDLSGQYIPFDLVTFTEEILMENFIFCTVLLPGKFREYIDFLHP